jgi:hypothetical protein
VLFYQIKKKIIRAQYIKFFRSSRNLILLRLVVVAGNFFGVDFVRELAGFDANDFVASDLM